MTMRLTFQFKVGHLAFDHARVAAVVAFGQLFPSDVANESVMPLRQLRGRNDLTFKDSLAEKANGVDQDLTDPAERQPVKPPYA